MFDDFSRTGLARIIFYPCVPHPIYVTHMHSHTRSQIILPSLLLPFFTRALTHTFAHTHFFWMIKSEESDHTIMWEMCFSDIIEMGKKTFLEATISESKIFHFLN